MKTPRHEPRGKAPDRVREPVQVYLDPPDRERLERLTRDLGMSKSEVLRKGLKALEALAPPPPPGGGLPPLPTFGGRGLLAGVDLDDSSALLDRMEGRDAPS